MYPIIVHHIFFTYSASSQFFFTHFPPFLPYVSYFMLHPCVMTFIPLVLALKSIITGL